MAAPERKKEKGKTGKIYPRATGEASGKKREIEGGKKKNGTPLGKLCQWGKKSDTPNLKRAAGDRIVGN